MVFRQEDKHENVSTYLNLSRKSILHWEQKSRQPYTAAIYAELLRFVINLLSSSVIFQQEPSFMHSNTNTQIRDYQKKKKKI